ncbi:MFS transporter [Trinickia symbiotica]|uniref:MFS transporter n=1 Tax=Trinickia symbiotica TaxID=863227 RepID=A0A2T3XUC7_9BURK|nr:MFS transporter [Trinickia symbiotica]PTB20114.1 MFS transporter [Trinickia symbiotica]
MSWAGSASDARVARAARALSTFDHLQIASLWFALFAQWMTVVPVLVPDQIAWLLGPHAAMKEGAAGSVIAAGALVALVVSPIAGALSDRCVSRKGRRRPYLIIGTFGIALALLWLASFGYRGSIVVYSIAFLHLQFWWNWVSGPYAGLVPDVVPETERNRASAWLNVMTVVGIVGGNALLIALYSPHRLYPVVATFIALTFACLWLTIRGAREPAVHTPRERFDARAFARSFYLDPRLHRNFYWVLITRFFSNMGVWSVFTFMLYYLQDVIGVSRPVNILNVLLGAGTVLAIPTSLLGARLADRHGTVAVVRATSWIMAGAVIGYVLLALRPSLAMVVPVALVFSAAYGTYQSVDWALALEVLPDGASAGKDMGIWNVSMVLPQIVGPAVTGWMLSWVRTLAGAGPAYIVSFAVAAGWFVLAAWFVSRIRLAHPTPPD